MKIIFGGAFNPVHNEHVNIVKYLLTLEGVDTVILLPSVNPPHKECSTSFEQRIDMLKIATSDLERCPHRQEGARYQKVIAAIAAIARRQHNRQRHPSSWIPLPIHL